MVVAETTAVESTDVFLPYGETSGPSLDLYLSGVRGEGSVLITARRDPVYGDGLEWLVSASAGRFDIEAGQVFPTLSPFTLSWTVGQGAVVSARTGRSAAELVGMRVAEADTLAGFGVYSRFALGGRLDYDWSDGLRTSLVYLSVLDRAGSVAEEQQLTEPLRNSVVAGLLRAGDGDFTGELEFARSDASGETDGHGAAVRVRLTLEKDWRNRVSLEYASSEPGFYSAGSYEYDRGEHSLELDYSVSPNGRVIASGWVRTGRTFDSTSALAWGEYELKVYSRVELMWPGDAGDARAYAVARCDRVPYDTYDYRYCYGALGGTWRRGRTRVLANVSWSDTRSPDETTTRTASCDVRRSMIWDRLTVGASARWTAASGEGADYTRTHVTTRTAWDFGTTDLALEYWLIDREDRMDTTQSYVEHVLTVTIGRDL